MYYFVWVALIWMACSVAGSTVGKAPLLDERMIKLFFNVFCNAEDCPSTPFPSIDELTDEDWIALMSYDSIKLHNGRSEFDRSDIDSHERMKAFSVDWVSEEKVSLNSLYLEGLCRLGKVSLVEEIIKSFGNRKLQVSDDYPPTVRLSLLFPQLLTQQDVIRSASHPFLRDQHIIALDAAFIESNQLAFSEFLEMRWELMKWAVGRIRPELFEHVVDAYFSLVKQEEAAVVLKTIEVAGILSFYLGSAVVYSSGDNIRTEIAMFRYFLKKLSHEHRLGGCQKILNDVKTGFDPNIIAVCKEMELAAACHALVLE